MLNLFNKNHRHLLSFPENDKGQYISPFHDIPIYADADKVIYIIPVNYMMKC